MRLAPILVGAGMALGLILFFTKRAEANPAPALWTDNMASWLDNLTQDASKNEARYRDAIAAAERAQGLPAGLLARLLYQESHYRTDIITGATRSPAGALGIAQFMPETARDLGVNPLDPLAAIAAAARYLRQLHDHFEDWQLALAAYNFGWGNVDKGRTWPDETVAYVSEIATDVGLA